METFLTCFFFNFGKVYITKFTVFKCKFSGIECIHVVLQPSLPFISRSFSSSLIEARHPLNTDSPFLPPLAPGSFLLSVSRGLTSPSWWDQTVFVLLRVA